MLRSTSLFIGTSFTVAVFTIFATSNVDWIVGIPHKIYSMQSILIHIYKKPISLLNVPICTQGMQRTWWPEAGTIIVTGPYSMVIHLSHLSEGSRDMMVSCQSHLPPAVCHLPGGDVTFWKRSCVATAAAISKRRCDFKTQMRFQNADATSKRRCDFKTQMRFQNADAISKRRCDFKTQMRFQDPGYLYCECNRSWIYLGDAYHNKLYTVELRI